MFFSRLFIGACLFAALSSSSFVHAEDVQDLSSWQTDGDGVWTYDDLTNTWTQSYNSKVGAFLYGDTNTSLGMAISGSITVNTASDDDWIGFAIGYNEGDDVNDDADYILLTWKQSDQGDWSEGLRLWHVTGAFSYNYITEIANDPSFTLISKSTNYSETGWEDFTEYNFDVTYDVSALGIFINDSLEYALTPGDFGLETFADGNFALFNSSQSGVVFSNVVFAEITSVLDIEQQEALANEVPNGSTGFALCLAGLLACRGRKYLK